MRTWPARRAATARAAGAADPTHQPSTLAPTRRWSPSGHPARRRRTPTPPGCLARPAAAPAQHPATVSHWRRLAVGMVQICPMRRQLDQGALVLRAPGGEPATPATRSSPHPQTHLLTIQHTFNIKLRADTFRLRKGLLDVCPVLPTPRQRAQWRHIGLRYERWSEMTRILIAYGTTEGQTARIADHIADAIRKHGVEAER